MTTYSVNIVIDAAKPLTEDQIMAVAGIGGAATATPGKRRIETTLSSEGADMIDALSRAAARILELVPGKLVAIEATTIKEADRRLADGDPMVGVMEIAAMLGVSKQRASTVARRADFPAPVSKLSQGKAWRKADVERFNSGWERKNGRPKSRAAK